VQLQAAIDALPAPGGLIYMTAGVFTFSEGVTIVNPGVSITGAIGFSQVINKGTDISATSNNITLFTYNPAARTSPFYLGNLTMAGGSPGTGVGVYLQKNVNSMVMENIFFATFGSAAIRIEDDGTGDAWSFANIEMDRVEVETNGEYAFYAKQGGGRALWGLRFNQCHFVGGTIAAFYCEGANNMQFIGGVIENTADGMIIKSSNECNIIGVNFYNWDQGSTSLLDALRLDGVTENINIIGNTFKAGAADSRYAISVLNGTEGIVIANNSLAAPSGGGSIVAPMNIAAGARVYVGPNPGLAGTSEKIITVPSTGGWSKVTANGGDAVQENAIYQTLRAAAAANSTVTRYLDNLPILAYGGLSWNYADWDFPIRFKFAVSRNTNDAEAVSYIQIKDATARGVLAEDGIGISFANMAMTGESYDTARSTVALGNIVVNQTSYIEIVLLPTIGVFFYVNGAYAGAITTIANVPSGNGAAGVNVVLSHGNGAAGVQSDLVVGGIQIEQGGW
jgi:hypothetical protein